MNRRTERTLALAAVLALVWWVVDLALARQSQLLVLPALVPYVAMALVICGFVWARARLARRADEERRDRELARQERPEAALFQQDAEKFEPFSIGRTHQQFERWLVPLFTLLLAIGQGYWAWRLFTQLDQPHDPPADRLVASALLAGQTFLLFLFSRYLLGLSRHTAQRLLRGPGVALGVACVASLLATAAAIIGEAAEPRADRLAALVLIAGLAVAAVELFLNFIWELYRPRRRGQLNRAYESRLGGLLTDPAGWVRDIGGALDYQFGFKVSDTWLYRFLENALLPLIIFQIVILYLLSTLVFLGPDEEGIIERFGRPRTENWHLESGFHLKWPWPFETLQRFPAKRVLTTEIGFSPHRESTPGVDPTVILWNVPHFAAEDQFLVASHEATGADSESVTVPVNLLSFNVAIEYRIRDLRQYAYRAADPRQTLEQLAYRTLTLSAASRDLFDVITQGRAEMATELRRLLEIESNRLGLGIEIVFVGIKGAHPPVSVAEAFQSVIGATEEREAAVLKAQAAANQVLPRAQGEAVRRVQEAQAYVVRRATNSAAQADWFLKRLAAYQQAPAVFRTRLYLSSLKQGLAGARKYVNAASPETEVTILNFEEPLAPDLFDFAPPEKP